MNIFTAKTESLNRMFKLQIQLVLFTSMSIRMIQMEQNYLKDYIKMIIYTMKQSTILAEKQRFKELIKQIQFHINYRVKLHIMKQV